MENQLVKSSNNWRMILYCEYNETLVRGRLCFELPNEWIVVCGIDVSVAVWLQQSSIELCDFWVEMLVLWLND